MNRLRLSDEHVHGTVAFVVAQPQVSDRGVSMAPVGALRAATRGSVIASRWWIAALESRDGRGSKAVLPGGDVCWGLALMLRPMEDGAAGEPT